MAQKQIAPTTTMTSTPIRTEMSPMSYLFASVGQPSIGSQDVRVKREAASNRGAPRFRFPIEIRPNVGTPLAARLADEQ
jgi:hypothetical protein